MKPTLVVLAAGMGSRYGGLKQVDPVGPSGEAILDYSVFDAHRAGFGKVVFVIRKSFEEEFREKVGAKYSGILPVEYSYQDIADLPAPYTVPEGREKPWGTAHAIRSARGIVKEPFAAINADDFYGRDAFSRLAGFIKAPQDGGKLHFAMVGYNLGLTLSENGSVARNEEDPENPVEVPLDARVSMNLWGFTPELFDELEKRFPAWLEANGKAVKSEWYIPFVVDEMIKDGTADAKVLPTESSWFGITYRDDKPFVMESIRHLVDAGEYPAKLF